MQSSDRRHASIARESATGLDRRPAGRSLYVAEAACESHLARQELWRTVVARGLFDKQPTAKQLCALLDRAVRDAGTAPRHIVSDQGVQFRDEYRAWCKKRDVKPRFGAVGQHGSIAVVERFIRSMKYEAFARIVVPLSLRLLARELDAYLAWYHEHRPHQALGGRTPSDVLEAARKNLRSRRQRAPPKRRSKMRPLRLLVSFVEGRRHLPVVSLKRAA